MSERTAVSNFRRHLNAAINRSGMHHDRIWRGAFPDVLGLRPKWTAYSRIEGKNAASLPLALDSKNHHYVGAFQLRPSIVRSPRASLASTSSAELQGAQAFPGPATLTMAPSFVSKVEWFERGRTARVQYITNDRDLEPFYSWTCVRGWSMRPVALEWDVSCEPSPALTMGALPILARCLRCAGHRVAAPTMQSGRHRPPDLRAVVREVFRLCLRWR